MSGFASARVTGANGAAGRFNAGFENSGMCLLAWFHTALGRITVNPRGSVPTQGSWGALGCVIRD
jgi:hypothetical protein